MKKNRAKYHLEKCFLAGFAFLSCLGSACSGAEAVGASSAGSETFFDQFVLAGGPIVWFVLIPMSIFTVYLAMEHFITIRRKRLVPSGVGLELCTLIRRFGAGQLKTRISKKHDMVSKAILNATEQAGNDRRHVHLRTLAAESLEEQSLEILRKVEWTNIIGNVAPMIGLFGTVFGMIKAFNGIVIAGGQPQPAHLAGGISLALVTTFWGLLIGIPALAVHGVFRNRVEGLASEAAMECETVLTELRNISLSEKDKDDEGEVEQAENMLS